MHFENANEVTIVINAAVALATKQDVIDHNADPDAHSIMKSDAVTSTSSKKVATSKAVKTVNDKIVTHTGKTTAHIPEGGTTGDVLLKTQNGSEWKKLALVPAGHIYPVPFPPNELPANHYVPNGEGVLKTSEAGKTLLSMSAAYKTAHGITENSTHVFLPNVFDTNGDGYFPRFVDGVNRKVGSKQDDAIRNITGKVLVMKCGENVYDREGALKNTTASSYSTSGHGSGTYNSTLRLDFDASLSVPTADENRPKNYGFTPAIYLPPLGDA